jgi:membrane-associated protease RseP (regulator of RpoE activity)
MEVTVRGTSVDGITPVVPNIRILFNDDHHGGWTEVARSYDQSPLYLQSGVIVSLNGFEPGEYKVVVGSDLVTAPSQFNGTINFTKNTSYDEPGQVAYNVTINIFQKKTILINSHMKMF